MLVKFLGWQSALGQILWKLFEWFIGLDIFIDWTEDIPALVIKIDGSIIWSLGFLFILILWPIIHDVTDNYIFNSLE